MLSQPSDQYRRRMDFFHLVAELVALPLLMPFSESKSKRKPNEKDLCFCPSYLVDHYHNFHYYQFYYYLHGSNVWQRSKFSHGWCHRRRSNRFVSPFHRWYLHRSPVNCLESFAGAYFSKQQEKWLESDRKKSIALLQKLTVAWPDAKMCLESIFRKCLTKNTIWPYSLQAMTFDCFYYLQNWNDDSFGWNHFESL